MIPSEKLEVTEQTVRLPWHQPVVQRLVVTVDTRFGGASTEDGDTFESIATDAL